MRPFAKHMKNQFLYLLILLLSSQHTFSQTSISTNYTTLTNDSLYPGGQITWGDYLKKNVDTTAPIKNRAKKGAYTVIVKFIVTKDGSVSDVQAITNYGYGMEEAVIRVVKKSKSWTPAPQNVKPVYRVGTVSFTFTVTKRKLFGKKKSGKKTAKQ